MPRPIPIVLCIDVEPDDRQFDPADARHWRGFEGLVRWMAGVRARLPAANGAPRLAWFVRADAQVAEGFGSPDWALTHYARDIDALRAGGDELGLHAHAYRWDGPARSWVIDHGDARWVEGIVREAFAVFEHALGSACRMFRFGDHWMSNALVRVLAELGAAVDVTLEPGMPAIAGLVAGERHTGEITDLASVPRTPYQPSARDFRVADPSRPDGFWMMPVTTGRLSAPVRRARAMYRWLTRAADADFDVLALNAALAPVLFRAIAQPLLDSAPPPCLVLPVRSDVGARPRALARLQTNLEYLIQHPLRDRFAFCTPVQALEIMHPETRLSGSADNRG